MLYCGERCEAADEAVHGRVCRVLRFVKAVDAAAAAAQGAGLEEEEEEETAARLAASVKATVANLKLLGRQMTQHLVGPRGYKQRQQEEEEEEEEEGGSEGMDPASLDAVKPRWHGLFKLAKHDGMPALDAKPATHGEDGCSEAVHALKALGEALSYPLSIVAASWLFPVVKYALMLGVGGGRGSHPSDAPTAPAQVHVLGASRGECAARGAAWWTVGYGCNLDRPGAAITLVGTDVPSHLHGVSRGVGGASHTPKVSFHRGHYHDFVELLTETNRAAAKDEDGEDVPGPCLVFAADAGFASPDEDWELTLRTVRRAGCPLVTANSTLVEVSMEQEALEEAGYELGGMSRSPFAFPVPHQSPGCANDVYRKNEWLAVYVPTSTAGAAGGGGAGEGGASGWGGAGGEQRGQKRKNR